jgi:hypothetical protein
MTFQDDMQSDIDDMYDVDEFAVNATWFSMQTEITSASFPCFVGEAIAHGDEETGLIEKESITLSSPTENIENVKKRDIITINDIEYEVVGDPFANSIFNNILILWLRRKIETKI